MRRLHFSVLLVALVGGPALAQEPAREPARGGAAAATAQPAPAGEATGEAPPTPAETAWVRGEVKVNFRASTSPQATPLGIVTTGDQVIVLERKGSWARVQVEDGSAGWLPASYLHAEAPPLERAALLEGELTAVREELALAQREIETLQGRDEQLSARASEREAAFEQLEEENRDLRAGERWPYMVTGAAILGAGLTAGLLLRGGASRRNSARIRF